MNWIHIPLFLLAATFALLSLLARRKQQHLTQLLQHQRRAHMLELERARSALLGSGDAFFSLDLESLWLTVTRADGHVLRDFGFAKEQWQGELISPQDLPQIQRAFDQLLKGELRELEICFRVHFPALGVKWIRLCGKVLELEQANGKARKFSGIFSLLENYAEREDRLRTYERMFGALGEAVAITDVEFHFQQINPAFSRVTGYEAEDLAGLSTRVLDSRREAPERLIEARGAVQRRGYWQGELWQRRRDGTDFLAELRITEVRDESGNRNHFVATLSDVTDRRRSEAELTYLATRDALTGLFNRNSLVVKAREMMKESRQTGAPFSIVLVDLDRFREVNDALGHAAGDQLLARAGERMQHVLGTQTVLARIGGDEFVYLCNSADPVECKATKLIDAFVQPLAVAGSEIPVSPSIGLASFPHDGETVEELLRNADTAMASAKQRGRNQVQAFTSAMAEGRRQRLTLESALKRALQQDEFKLVYQPKYDLFKRKLTGVEALLRWDSRELGRVSPEQFIGIAENSGLILPISQWVLKEALSQSARWTERGLTGVKIAVNVSTLQLRQRHFARFVIDALALAGVSPELLELEITESLLMDEAEHSISQLNELRASGISIAIDDFGAAYSSLTYLRKLPIDTLKIDRSFIQGLGSDSDSTSIAKTIILLAQSLDLRTVAEGVEDDAQAEWLVQQECQEIQGFWLSPGIEADELTRFWSEFKPRTQARVIELASSRPPSAKNANQGG